MSASYFLLLVLFLASACSTTEVESKPDLTPMCPKSGDLGQAPNPGTGAYDKYDYRNFLRSIEVMSVTCPAQQTVLISFCNTQPPSIDIQLTDKLKTQNIYYVQQKLYSIIITDVRCAVVYGVPIECVRDMPAFDRTYCLPFIL